MAAFQGAIGSIQVAKVLPGRTHCAPTVALFVSDDASYVTGQSIFADGGWAASSRRPLPSS